MTDLGNAERLVHRHGHSLRYVEDRQEWRAWVTPYWRRGDLGPVYRCASATARSIADEAALLDPTPNINPITGKPAPSDQAKMLTHGLNSETRRAQEAMIALAGHIPPISCHASAFDRDPWMLNTPSGIIDLRADGAMRPCAAEAMMTRCTTAKYDAMAESQKWLEFLDIVTCGDTELRDWLQRAVGMSLIGAQREHLFLFLYGEGRNGKGTFLNTILHVLGDYALTLPPNLLVEKKFEAHPTELADLEGRRLAVGGEVPRGAAWDEVRIKSLSGGDRIRARRMRQDFIEFDATHTFWISGNDRPRVRGTDSGIWRRMRLVPFMANITEDQDDKDLKDKLLAESDGILWWALEGCRAYLQQGLGWCAAVKEATDSYRRDEDILGAFLEECCTVGVTESVTKESFRNALRPWLEEREYRPISDKMLKADLSRKNISEGRPDRSTPRSWLGVSLLPSVARTAHRVDWRANHDD